MPKSRVYWEIRHLLKHQDMDSGRLRRVGMTDRFGYILGFQNKLSRFFSRLIKK